MAFQINTTTVIDNSRNLTNIANQTNFVATGNVAIGVGGIGSYAMLRQTTLNTARSPGAIVAGSSLRYINSSGGGSPPEVTPPGTWRLMGAIGTGTTAETNTSIWLRIS